MFISPLKKFDDLVYNWYNGCIMNKIKIITDSNSGITQEEAKKLGIIVLPMPFTINGKEYFEDITLTQEKFYEYLETDASVSTSQPSIGDITDLWDKETADGSQIIYIPMSSGLSESCHTAERLAEDYKGKVFVVDNQRISITQKRSVLDALTMIEKGKSCEEIVSVLMETKMQASIYITLETLKYLKKGGRLTPAAALIGSILRIKPVLQIQGEKLDAFKKVQTMKKAKEVMIAALKHDLETRFADLVKSNEMEISVAHTNNLEAAKEFYEELKANFPNIPVTWVAPLSLSVSCHIGAGALACGCYRVVK